MRLFFSHIQCERRGKHRKALSLQNLPESCPGQPGAPKDGKPPPPTTPQPGRCPLPKTLILAWAQTWEVAALVLRGNQLAMTGCKLVVVLNESYSPPPAPPAPCKALESTTVSPSGVLSSPSSYDPRSICRRKQSMRDGSPAPSRVKSTFFPKPVVGSPAQHPFPGWETLRTELLIKNPVVAACFLAPFLSSPEPV